MNTARIWATFLSATFAGVALSQHALADPPAAAPSATDLALQQALAFERKHEFGKAVELWKPLADRGNAVAQFHLGEAYENGDGVAKDDAQAVTWYRKGAEHGDAAAQFSLGWMYEHGHGVAEDQAQAETWNRKAAEQGYAAAQYNVGVMYENGDGHPRDEAHAVAWYRKAAEQGYAAAQLNLGEMYAQGRGIAKDEAQAIVWYRKAAEQGDADAQVTLGMAYFLGQGVQENHGQAVHWFALAAQKGSESAVTKLEIVVATLPTLRMRTTIAVLARPEANAPVVKSTAAGEVAYRLSQFDNWYEVYFRDRNIVGYIDTSQASVVVADIPQPAASPIRKAAYFEPTSNFPPVPATRPGVTSYNTRCNNGQCLRTYDSGKHVAFQAEHKFNAFNNQWEWDAGSC